MTKLAVLQPGYLPWLGFFDLIDRCDIFVIYDDVQYDKHGWRNRNRVKSPKGEPHWLTVPVLHTNKNKPKIIDTLISNEQDWPRKQLGTIQQFYKQAPYFNLYFKELNELLSEKKYNLLVDLDLVITNWLMSKLSLSKEMHRSSDLDISGEKNDKLLQLCKKFNAQHYISGNAAADYLDIELFKQNSITVEFQNYTHPVYNQQHGEFLPFLSTLDLLFNHGPDSMAVIRSTQKGRS